MLQYRTALYYPDLISAFFVISTPFAPPATTYSDQATAIPTLHYQLQFRTDDVQDYIGPNDAQNVTRINQVLNTIYGATLPDGTIAFNSSGVGLLFDELDELSANTTLLSAEELDFYLEQYAADPVNRTLNWYRSGELNFQDELALVPASGVFTAKFSQPALYIGGLLDSALPPVLSTGMETYFDSLSRGLVNGSHWIAWSNPDEVNGIVGNWLTSSVFANVTAASAASSLVRL